MEYTTEELVKSRTATKLPIFYWEKMFKEGNESFLPTNFPCWVCDTMMNYKVEHVFKCPSCHWSFNASYLDLGGK